MKKLDIYLNIPIIKTSGKSCDIIDEPVIVEHFMTLVLNDKYKTRFLCTPRNLEELVAGYLLTKGMIKVKDDILKMQFNEENKICYGKISRQKVKENYIASSLTLEIETIYEIMSKNLNYSEVFKKTGGVHSVAIFDKEEKIVIMEDVARHNAVDKAIGYCLLNDIYLGDKILVVSGRISAEMIVKARRSGIPIVISKSAPTSLSVEIANKSGITLIGFVREKTMNIYSNIYRINLEDEIFRKIVRRNRKIHIENIKKYIKN